MHLECDDEHTKVTTIYDWSDPNSLNNGKLSLPKKKKLGVGEIPVFPPFWIKHCFPPNHLGGNIKQNKRSHLSQTVPAVHSKRIKNKKNKIK